jgi:site-specific recombinase XerD
MRDAGSIEQMVRKIGKRAGVDNVHPHRFRRTSATIALRRGMPIEMVSKMLGHEQISTTQIYLDLSDDDLEAAHRKYVV